MLSIMTALSAHFALLFILTSYHVYAQAAATSCQIELIDYSQVGNYLCVDTSETGFLSLRVVQNECFDFEPQITDPNGDLYTCSAINGNTVSIQTSICNQATQEGQGLSLDQVVGGEYLFEVDQAGGARTVIPFNIVTQQGTCPVTSSTTSSSISVETPAMAIISISREITSVTMDLLTTSSTTARFPSGSFVNSIALNSLGSPSSNNRPSFDTKTLLSTISTLISAKPTTTLSIPPSSNSILATDISMANKLSPPASSTETPVPTTSTDDGSKNPDDIEWYQWTSDQADDTQSQAKPIFTLTSASTFDSTPATTQTSAATGTFSLEFEDTMTPTDSTFPSTTTSPNQSYTNATTTTATLPQFTGASTTIITDFKSTIGVTMITTTTMLLIFFYAF